MEMRPPVIEVSIFVISYSFRIRNSPKLLFSQHTVLAEL